MGEFLNKPGLIAFAATEAGLSATQPQEVEPHGIDVLSTRAEDTDLARLA